MQKNGGTASSDCSNRASGAAYPEVDKLHRSTGTPELTRDWSEMAKRKPQSGVTKSRLAPRRATPGPSDDSERAARRPKSRSGPRTASGKKANPGTLADAEQSALAGLKERTEEGHLKAGRTPP